MQSFRLNERSDSSSESKTESLKDARNGLKNVERKRFAEKRKKPKPDDKKKSRLLKKSAARRMLDEKRKPRKCEEEAHLREMMAATDHQEALIEDDRHHPEHGSAVDHHLAGDLLPGDRHPAVGLPPIDEVLPFDRLADALDHLLLEAEEEEPGDEVPHLVADHHHADFLQFVEMDLVHDASLHLVDPHLVDDRHRPDECRPADDHTRHHDEMDPVHADFLLVVDHLPDECLPDEDHLVAECRHHDVEVLHQEEEAHHRAVDYRHRETKEHGERARETIEDLGMILEALLDEMDLLHGAAKKPEMSPVMPHHAVSLLQNVMRPLPRLMVGARLLASAVRFI